jgi:cobalamin biosynthesis protein CobW
MVATRIPATVITGFLGAGKTTLIRNLLEKADGQRFALIVNEFGDVGVDGEVLASCNAPGCSEDDIIELANGCICCTVADDFLPSMQKLLAQEPKPDHIIIETSGLALPQPLVQAFGWPDIKSQVMLDGVVTIVDGAALAAGDVVLDRDALDAQRQADPELNHETPIDELFRDQVTAANLLVISKGDLLDESQQNRVMTDLMELTHDDTPLLMTQGKGAPMTAIFGLGLEDEAFVRSKHYDHHHHDDDDHEHGHGHGHDEFTSVVINIPEIADHVAFTENLKAVAGQQNLLRAKGFLRIAGKAMPLVVQAVGSRVDHYFGGSLDGDEGKLVLIGLKNTDMAAIAGMLGGRL